MIDSLIGVESIDKDVVDSLLFTPLEGKFHTFAVDLLPFSIAESLVDAVAESGLEVD
jgi:hypothetical protein